MTFLWPLMLLSFVSVPLFVWIYFRIQQRRRLFTARFRSLGVRTGPQGFGSSPGVRRHIPPALFLAGLIILLVGLARPQTVVSLPHVEGTVILAFDVSGSMAADDLKPTRIDAAKAAAQDFVKRQPPTVQIGVVGFTDSGFSLQAPTNDQATVLEAISRLEPQRGTSLGHGIEASLNAIDQERNSARNQQQLMPWEPSSLSMNTPAPTLAPTPMPKGSYTSAVVVLLSDGENNENPDPLGAAQTAADHGVRIYTVGIGSPTGTNLHINGFTVFTRLNDALLKQISEITDGTYYNAENTQDLISIYDHLDPQLYVKPEKIEITSIFAGASVLVMLLGGIFSLTWFNRLP